MSFDELFTLTSSGDGRWTAAGAPNTDERCLYGGVLIGQAIVAASQETRPCHALHALFINMGQKEEPFEIAVDRTRDGGSFSTRRMEIFQNKRLLLAGYSSHHRGDLGPTHQVRMPDVPAPETLQEAALIRARDLAERGVVVRRYLAEQMLEIRPLVLPSSGGSESAQAFWFRSRTPIRGDLSVHQAVLGFASDMPLVRVGLQRHGKTVTAGLQTASLDHSLWFHRDATFDDWMLQVVQSSTAEAGRGLSTGHIFARDGRLVASVAQEFLARQKRAQG